MQTPTRLGDGRGRTFSTRSLTPASGRRGALALPWSPPFPHLQGLCPLLLPQTPAK